MTEIRKCPDCGSTPRLYQRERPKQFKIKCECMFCKSNSVVVARTREKATAKWNKEAERSTQAKWKKVVE